MSSLSLIAFRANVTVLHGVVALETKQEDLSYPVFLETLITAAVQVDSKLMKIQSNCNKKQMVLKLYLCIAVQNRLIFMPQTGSELMRSALTCEIKAIHS